MISNARYTIRDGDGGEGGAISESIISNARDGRIKGDSSHSILVGIADDVCAERFCIIRRNNITICGGVGDNHGAINSWFFWCRCSFYNILNETNTASVVAKIIIYTWCWRKSRNINITQVIRTAPILTVVLRTAYIRTAASARSR